MLLAQHTAQGRVGRRVAPESASEVLSARNDGQQSFSAAYQCLSGCINVKILFRIRDHPRYPRGKFASIRVHSRLKNNKCQ
jgi:hypothetical protein